MTRQEYDAICARIDKAESLPEDAMRERYVRNAYHDLCDQAAEFERANGEYFRHSIHDQLTRDIIRKLVSNICAMRDVVNAQERMAKASAALSDMMALATTPDERVLEIFGYKEIEE